MNIRLAKEIVLAAIERNGNRTESIHDFSWRIWPGDEASDPVTATLEDDWLLLATPTVPNSLAGVGAWELLERNSALPGLVKFALTPHRQLQIRAELRVAEDVDLSTPIAEAWKGFACARSDENSTTRTEGAGLPSIGSATEGVRGNSLDPQTASAPQLDLKRLCTDIGWPFIERGPDKLLVELETPNQFWQATVTHAAGAVRIACSLLARDSIPDASLEPIGTFLLSASGALRPARAAATTEEVRLEVLYTTAPSPSDISSALESLSVGCSLAAEETKMLQTVAIAQRYLQLHGASACATA